MEKLVEINNLRFECKDKIVLDAIDLTIYTNDYLGLIGPNGGGKTTLLKLLLGLYKPTKGEISIAGYSPRYARGLIGYVPQFSRFESDFPITVLDVVLMGRLSKCKVGSRFLARDVEVATDCLRTVGLEEFANRQIGSLSGGELQRVLIARALAIEPKLLLLDEPTASVDTPFGEALYGILAELNKKIAIVLVSHDVGVLAREVKTIACLNRNLFYHHGKEISQETIEKVYGCPIDLVSHGHAHRVLGTHDECKQS